MLQDFYIVKKWHKQHQYPLFYDILATERKQVNPEI